MPSEFWLIGLGIVTIAVIAFWFGYTTGCKESEEKFQNKLDDLEDVYANEA